MSEEIKRGPGRPKKTEVIFDDTQPLSTESSLPVEVSNALHGRSSELIKIIEEMKDRKAILDNELESAQNELQVIQSYILEHEVKEDGC